MAKPALSALLASLCAPWWRPGVYGTGPAVLLWIVARLPAGWLMWALHSVYGPAWVNTAGDTVFVAGWLASAALLWAGRRELSAPARQEVSRATSTPPVAGHPYT